MSRKEAECKTHIPRLGRLPNTFSVLSKDRGASGRSNLDDGSFFASTFHANLDTAVRKQIASFGTSPSSAQFLPLPLPLPLLPFCGENRVMRTRVCSDGEFSQGRLVGIPRRLRCRVIGMRTTSKTREVPQFRFLAWNVFASSSWCVLFIFCPVSD